MHRVAIDPHYAQTPLLVLLDLDDWACAQVAVPEIHNATLLVFDLDLHLTLKTHKIQHVTVWELLSAEDKPAVHQRAAEAWDFWQQAATLTYAGLDLFRMASVRHAGWVNRASFVTFVVQRAIEQWQPSLVITFEETEGHGLTPPSDYHKMPLLFMLVRGMAERRGIPVRLITKAEQSRRPGYADQIEAAKAEQPGPPIDVEIRLPHEPFVLFFGNGIDLRRQRSLIQSLHEHDHIAAVQLYRSVSESLREELQANGHLFFHDEQVAPCIPVVLDEDVRTAAREHFDAAAAELTPELADIFANPACEPHYAFLFGPYVNALAGHVKRWQKLFRRVKPALLVVHSPEPVVEIATQAGIPALTLPHSLMLTGEPEYVSEVGELTVGAISPAHAQRLIEFGLKPSQVRLTGDPTADLVRAEAEAVEQGERRRIRAALGVDDSQRLVLIATGCLAMPAQQVRLPRIDWHDAAQSFNRLVAALAQQAGWHAIVKQHPRYDHPLLVDYANRELPEEQRVVRVEHESLSSLVAAADAVVIFNIITSALIEASFQPRPVMVLSESMCWYDARQWEMHHWPHFNGTEALMTHLQQLFDDPESYRAAVAQTAAAREAYLGADQDAALTRSVAAVRDLMQASDVVPAP